MRGTVTKLGALLVVLVVLALLAGCSGKAGDIAGNPAVTGAISFGSSQACAEWAAKNPEAAANSKVYIAGIVQAGQSCLAGIDAAAGGGGQ